MTSTRRDFLKSTAAIGAAAVLRARPAMGSLPIARARGKKILVLGGTAFLGPKVVEAALARGHTVTVFNRGRTEKRIPFDFKEVEHLFGNRDPNLPADDAKGSDGKLLHPDSSPKGLEQLVGRKWDVVIDDCGFYPRMVKASAELLAPNVKQYIFISSISCYANNKAVGADESAPVAKLADPTVESMGASFENYGGLKALCEQAAEAAMPGRVANVRPGYIVGPGDPSDRFTYWPVRIDRGGEVLAPGTPDDPVQWIDVRDLAAWLVKLAEDGTCGVFNAVGPEQPGRWGSLLDECTKLAKNKATITWVDADFLEKNGAGGEDGPLPIWIAPRGDYAGFHRWSNARAVKAGLAFRPLTDTLKDTLAWYPVDVERRMRVTQQLAEEAAKNGAPAPKLPDPHELRAGLKPDREHELLAKWHAVHGQG